MIGLNIIVILLSLGWDLLLQFEGSEIDLLAMPNPIGFILY